MKRDVKNLLVSIETEIYTAFKVLKIMQSDCGNGTNVDTM